MQVRPKVNFGGPSLFVRRTPLGGGEIFGVSKKKVRLSNRGSNYILVKAMCCANVTASQYVMADSQVDARKQCGAS